MSLSTIRRVIIIIHLINYSKYCIAVEKLQPVWRLRSRMQTLLWFYVKHEVSLAYTVCSTRNARPPWYANCEHSNKGSFYAKCQRIHKVPGTRYTQCQQPNNSIQHYRHDNASNPTIVYCTIARQCQQKNKSNLLRPYRVLRLMTKL